MPTPVPLTTIAGAVLLLAVLASVSFLGYTHVIAGGAVVSIIATIVSLAGGGFAVHAGVSAGAAAAQPTEPAKK